MRKLTKEQFVSRSREIHGDLYGYDVVTYKGNRRKVTILCKEHGYFSQLPKDHMRGVGCPVCGGSKTSTLEKFIEKSNVVHSGKYFYILSNYVNSRTPIDIICQKHGVFKQIPSDHLNGVGCPKCGGSYNYDTEHFIKLARSIHGFKYDYSITKYNTAHSFVKIVCPEHGVFEQKASGHLTGKGCRKCAKYGFNTSEKGYVYFLISECSMFIKVGITKSLNRRLKELKTATPFEFSLFKFYELDGQSCVHIEKYFHTSYEKANLKDFDGSTEWLKYSKELMNDIL